MRISPKSRRPGDLILILMLLIPMVPANAAAGENTGDLFWRQWSVSGMFFALDDDSRRNTNDGFGAQVGIGTGFSGQHSASLVASQNAMHRNGPDGDIEQWSAAVNYRYRLGDSSYFSPYVLGELGYMKTQFSGNSLDDYASGIASLGLGVLTPIEFAGMNARAEFKARADLNDERGGSVIEYMLMVGFELPFNRARVIPVDLDSDRVPDDKDRCEGTPAGVDVDSFGCAKDIDTDGDGVTNSTDMCGGTPAGATVDQFGCRTGAEPSPI